MYPERNLNRPRLRSIENRGEERHASWLELFFDLVFVLAVAQVALVLHNDLTAGGAIRYAALFAPVWWAWIGYSFYADRFESDEATYRLLMFAGMLTVAALSVNVRGAYTPEGAAPFIFSYIAVRALLILLYVRAAYYVPLARDLCVRYSIGFSAGASLWVLSAFVEPPARYVLWAAGMLVEILTPIISRQAVRRTPYDASHMPERFGLFTIIVLGEAVLATANGAADTQWTLTAVLAAIIGFALACALWWINFEFVEDDALRSGWSLRSQVFLYGHYLMVVGIVAAGIGAEYLIEDASYGALPVGVRAALCGGVALFLAAITVMRLAAGRCPLVWSRIAGIAVVLVLLITGGYFAPLVLAAALLLVLIADVYVEGRYADAAGDEVSQETTPQCSHLDQLHDDVTPNTDGCEECLRGKQKWVHLRLCLVCGHVGCCDSSENKHATRHFRETNHPVMKSLEARENWAWCYVDETFVTPPEQSRQMEKVRAQPA